VNLKKAESAEEEVDETEGSNDYDYLLGMAIGSLAKEKVRFYCEARCLTLRLKIIYLDWKASQAQQQRQHGATCNTQKTPIQMWNQALDIFMDVCSFANPD